MTTLFHNDAYQISMLYAHWVSDRSKVPVTAEAFFRKNPVDLNRCAIPAIMAAAYRINEFINSSVMTEPFSEEDMPFIQNEVLRISDEAFAPFHTYLMEEFPKELQALEILTCQDGDVIPPQFPAVQITGSVGAVHMMETPILSFLNTSVRAASLAHAIRRRAPEASFLDFATRRQDDEAAVHTAVAAVIGGFDGTSNLEAGRRYELAVRGTMAHSYVLSFGYIEEGSERVAFRTFMEAFPETHALLVDTYDTMKGVAQAIRASIGTGIPLRAVRLDSGDFKTLVPQVRKVLDLFDCTDTKILVSGDVTEKTIVDLPYAVRDTIDGFGIGSRLGCPDFSMGFVYKIVETLEVPVMKKSEGGKTSLPGRKFWYRTGTTQHLSVLAPIPTLEFVSALLSNPGPVPVSRSYIQEARKRTSDQLHLEPIIGDDIKALIKTP